jgi:hypothetical protein
MTTYKYFQVKSGDNKGHYIAIDDNIERDKQRSIMGSNGFVCGSINKINNPYFYKYHGCKNATIWLISSYYTGHRISEDFLNKVKIKLNNEGIKEVEKFIV